MLNDCDIINFIKINRLRWAGHVARMDDKEITKRILTLMMPSAWDIGYKQPFINCQGKSTTHFVYF